MAIHLPKDVARGILAAVQSGRFASVDAAMTETASLLLQQLRQTETNPAPTSQSAPQPKPLWEETLELTADVPREEWDKLPPDRAEQHDHYIYGTPKCPRS